MTARTAFVGDLILLALAAVAMFLGGQPGWIMLAAGGGLIATRSWARIAVAIVTIAAAGAIATVGLVQGQPAALVGGLIGIGAGAWAAWSGRTWPALGARYERTTTKNLSTWDALDAGLDPTDEPSTPAAESEGDDGPRSG